MPGEGTSRRLSARVPAALRREWDEAAERRRQAKGEALASAVAAFCRAEPRAQMLLYHDAFARYYANGAGDARKAVSGTVPAEVAGELTRAVQRLGLQKGRAIAAAASAFAHLPDDAAARLAAVKERG